MSIHDARLYLIVTPRPDVRDLDARVAAALGAGVVDRVQVRLRHVAPAERTAAAQAVQARAQDAGIAFVVNDDIALAAHLGADGVHLGQDDASPDAARDRLGPHALVGWSTHDEAEMRAAHTLPVDHVGLGPCFPTATKALALPPGGPALLRRVLPHAGDLPVFPIGGITVANAPRLVEAGARRLAVGAGILGADDPAEAAARLATLLAAAAQGTG